MMRRRSPKLRAPASGVRLTEADAAVIKGMLLRGDRQHDIAAWFGVNGGRIGEIATGKTFAWVETADEPELPPAGPYPTGRQAIEAQMALERALDALAVAESSLQALGARRVT